MDIILGTEFQKLNVVRKISEGLTSSVYQLANNNEDDGQLFALKNFKQTCKLSNRIKEITIQSTLDHANIIKINKYDELNHNWIILEYFGTSDLFDVISTLQQPLTERAIRYIFKQIVDVIAYLHLKGIYHRDIKLENILFSKETAQIKVCDFGFTVGKNDGKVTRCVGTQGYIAPEIQNTPQSDVFVDAATLAPTDVFSLGSLLFTLVFGHQAFKDTKRMSCAYWRMIEDNKWDKYWNLIAKFNPVSPSTDLKLLLQSILTTSQTERVNLQDLQTSAWMMGDCATQEEVLTEIKIKLSP